MANNYTLASFMYPYNGLTREEAEAAYQKGLVAAAKEEGWDDPEDICVGNVDFQPEGIWFSHDESINIEAAVCVLSELQKANPNAKPFTFSYCFECSKPRLDEFGGGAFCINPDGQVFHVNPEDAVTKIALEAWHAAGHLNDDEFRCDRCGAVEDIEDSIKVDAEYVCINCADKEE